MMALILWRVQRSLGVFVCLRWVSSKISLGCVFDESLARLLYVSGEFQMRFRSSAERHAFAVLLHQWHQAAGRASLQQERVLQQVGCTVSLFCVTSQHAVQKVLQHRGHLNTEGHHKQEPGWRETWTRFMVDQAASGFVCVFVLLLCVHISYIIVALCKIWKFLDN